MPTTLTDAPAQPLAQDLPRKRWTRAEVEAIEPTGIWENQRLELIEGELLTKMPKKRRHVGVVALLHAWLAGIFGSRFINTEASIDVSPEDNPDRKSTRLNSSHGYISYAVFC